MLTSMLIDKFYMNYRVTIDGEMSCIEAVEEDADGEEIFETLTEAKQAILSDLYDRIRGLRSAVKKIRSLKKDDVEIV